MGQTTAPSSAEILQGLDWLRSAEPQMRARGIEVLCQVRDDPRIYKVFEHLYESDPDVRVRQVAWHALKGAEPSIPAPGPAAAAKSPAREIATPAVPSAAADPAPSQAATPRSATQGLFLLKPSHQALVTRYQNSRSRQRSGYGLFLLAIVIALVAAVLGVSVVPGLRNDYRLDRAGITVEGTITALSMVGRDFHVFYRFDTAHELEGVTWYADAVATEAAYNEMTVDDRVLVTYWPNDPTLSRLAVSDPGDVQRDRQIITAAVLGVVALLTLSLGIMRRNAVLRWRVIKGQLVACKAEVAGQKVTLCTRYRFKSPVSGKSVEGKTCQGWHDAPLPPAGTAIAVRYRDDRHHCML